MPSWHGSLLWSLSPNYIDMNYTTRLMTQCKTSVGNSHRSASTRPTTLEEDRELFVNFYLILCLRLEIQVMKTYNFFDWVSNTVQDCSNSIANALDLLQSCTKPWVSPIFRIPALMLGCTLAMYRNHGWPAWADLAYQKHVTEWCFGYWCTINHLTWSWDWAAQGGVSKTHMSSWIWELLKLECCIKVISYNVWVRYFVWNFKGNLWNSTQNIIPIHWKMRIQVKI